MFWSPIIFWAFSGVFFEESYWGNKRFLSPNFWWAFDLSIKDCHFYLEIEVNFVYISKGSLDLIPSAIKELWTFGFVVFIFFCQTLLGVFNKLSVQKSLLTMPRNALPLHLKPFFPPIIWIFTEGEGDQIESRLSSKIFFTLLFSLFQIIMT